LFCRASCAFISSAAPHARNVFRSESSASAAVPRTATSQLHAASVDRFVAARVERPVFGSILAPATASPRAADFAVLRVGFGCTLRAPLARLHERRSRGRLRLRHARFNVARHIPWLRLHSARSHAVRLVARFSNPNYALKRTCADEVARSITHSGRAGRLA